LRPPLMSNVRPRKGMSLGTPRYARPRVAGPFFANVHSLRGERYDHGYTQRSSEGAPVREASVEIYSDATNAAVVRHPNRSFPGVLIQGDTLHTMHVRACVALQAHAAGNHVEAIEELEELRDHLAELCLHYKRTLVEHGIRLPYAEDGVA